MGHCGIRDNLGIFYFCMPESQGMPDLSHSERSGILFISHKNSDYFLGFWTAFQGPLTLSLLGEVSNTPRRVHKNFQPLKDGWDPLLEFLIIKKIVHSAQIFQKSDGSQIL